MPDPAANGHTHSIALRDVYSIAYALGDADHQSTTRSFPLVHAHHSTTKPHTHRVSLTVEASVDSDVDSDAAYRAEQSDGSTV